MSQQGKSKNLKVFSAGPDRPLDRGGCGRLDVPPPAAVRTRRSRVAGLSIDIAAAAPMAADPLPCVQERACLAGREYITNRLGRPSGESAANDRRGIASQIRQLPRQRRTCPDIRRRLSSRQARGHGRGCRVIYSTLRATGRRQALKVPIVDAV